MSEEENNDSSIKKDYVIRDFDPTKGRKKKIIQTSSSQELKISDEERNVIVQLEEIIGKSLPKVNHVMWGLHTNLKHQIGYVIENGHVVELGLCPRIRGSFVNTFFQLKAVPYSIKSLQYLRVLDLSSNGLSSIHSNSSFPGLDILPEWFGDLASLKDLNLSWNKLTYLPESFGKLESLKTLHLYQNKLYKLPRSFGQLKNLRELYLSQNEIDHIPKEFGDLKSLVSLDLQGNKLNSIPDTFCSLSSLEFLSLAENNLDSLPSNISQLKSLTEFSLAENKIKVIPDSLSQLRSLNILNLFKNNLTKLPDNIGSLATLRVLDIRENEVSTLPKSFAHLTSLKTFMHKNNPWNRNIVLVLNNPLKIMLQILTKRAGFSIFIINEVSDIDKYHLQELSIDLEGDLIFQVEYSNLHFDQVKFEEILDQSDKVLFLTTLASMKSKSSRNQLEIALKKEKKIITLLGSDVSLENLAILGLDKEEYIDLKNIEYSNWKEIIYNKICDIQTNKVEISVNKSIIDAEISIFKIKTSIRNFIDSKDFMDFLGSKIQKNELNVSTFNGSSRETINKLIKLFESYIKFNKK